MAWHLCLFWQSLPFPLLPSHARGLTSQSHQQNRKPLSLLNGLTLWWKWLGLVRVCERRVTDGINHHNDRVRGGERGCWAVTDGTVCCSGERKDEKMWLIKQTLGIKAGKMEGASFGCKGQTERVWCWKNWEKGTKRRKKSLKARREGTERRRKGKNDRQENTCHS